MGKRWFSAVLAVSAVVALAGCSLEAYPEIPRFAKSGGQTQAELDAKLATIAGLVFTNASGSEPSMKGATGYGFDIELDPAYEIADLPGLIDFLAVSAWSVRDGYMPNATIAIGLDAGPELSDKMDIVAAAEIAGWVPVGSQTHYFGEDGGSSPELGNGWSSVEIELAIDGVSEELAEKRGAPANRERLGDWPGNAVEPPVGLVVPRTTSE